ncbi:MAG TPA: hypothetical protein VG733_17220 [Chthoniobacteraceae bacterium]|nr:hypothetical protein [Chthoniobacteraceae bacterium]
MRSMRCIGWVMVAMFCAAGGIATAGGPPVPPGVTFVPVTPQPPAAAQPQTPPAPTPQPLVVPEDLVVPVAADAFLAPPKAADITAFANDVKLPRDFKGVALTVDKEKVMEFFAGGEAHPANKDRARWRTLADFTLPDAIAADPALQAAKAASAGMPNGKVFYNSFIHTGGVVATSAGAVYFWQLWNDRVLELDDEAGRACLLVLGADAKPLAQFAHPYGGYDGADAPEKKLYGKLVAPHGGDIVAFANRPGDAGEGRRNYLWRELMNAYFTNTFARGDYNGMLMKFDGGLNPFAFDPNRAFVRSMNPGFPGKGLRMMPQQQPNITLESLRTALEGGADGDVICDGAMTTKDGRVIFWRMSADGMFYLMDDQHRTACVSSNMNGYTVARMDAACADFALGGSARTSILTYGEIGGGPSWEPGQPAPLAREDAVRDAWARLAEAVAAGDSKDPAAWRVARVATSRFSLAGARKWYYTVFFENAKEPGIELPVMVAMDGTGGSICTATEAQTKLQQAVQQYRVEMQQRAQDAMGMGFGGAGGFGGAVFRPAPPSAAANVADVMK